MDNTKNISPLQKIFVGRKRELDSIKRAINDPAIIFIVVYGLGGVGKTSLVQAAIRDISYENKYKGKVIWIDCHQNLSLEAILMTMASTLKIPQINQPAKMLRDQIYIEIKKKPIVLVLDRYEYLADSEDLLSFLGRLPKRNKVIIITRARIHVPGREITIRLEGFTENETKEYLEQTLGPKNLFELKPNELKYIFQLSGGLPLAVALITGQLKSTGSVSRLELQKAEDLTSFDVVERIIGHLYPLLDLRMKDIVNALAVFANPIDWRGIVAVADIKNWEQSDENELEQLSFVEQVGDRFSLHPVVRSFLRDTLEKNNPKGYRELQLQMVQYFLLYCARYQNDYIRMDQEWANILFSIETAYNSDFQSEFLGLVPLVGPYVTSRGMGFDYQIWIDRAIEKIPNINNQGVVASFLHNLGVWYQSRGDFSAARQAFEQSLVRLRQTGDQRGVSGSLSQIALLDFQQGNLKQAEEEFHYALEISLKHDDKNGELAILGNLGLLALRSQEYEKAESFLHEALDISKATNDRNAETKVLSNLGSVSLEMNKFESAAQYFTTALIISRELGDRQTEANTLLSLATANYQMRRFSDAAMGVKQALEITRIIGDRQAEINALKQLSSISREMGNYAEEEEFLIQALVISRELGNRSREIAILTDLGLLAKKMSKYDQSEAFLHEAIELSKDTGDKKAEARSLSNLGLIPDIPISIRADFLHQAVDLYQQVLESNTLDGDSAEKYAEILNNLAITLDSLHKTKEAIEYLEKALAFYESKDNPVQRANTLNNLGVIYLNKQNGDRNENLRRAINCFEKALEVYTPESFPREWLRVSNSLSIAYEKIKNWRKARQLIINITKTLHGTVGDQESLNALAPLYISLGDLAKNNKDYELAARIFAGLSHQYEINGNNVPKRIKTRLAKVREMIGEDKFVVIWGEVQGALTPILASILQEAMNSIESEDYSTAEKKFTQSLDALFGADDSQDLDRQRASIFFHRGFCLRKQEKWEDALFDLKEAFQTFEKLREFGSEARVLVEMGNIYSVMNNYEESRLCFMDAYRLYRRAGDNLGMAVASESLGRLEYSLRMIPQALADLEEARQLYILVGERGVAESIASILEDVKSNSVSRQI